MAKRQRHWENREFIKARLGSSGMGAHVCFVLGIIFAVLGIIADAANVTLGLTSVSWFLLAIVTLVVGLMWFFGVGLAWYLISTEAKSKKGE